MTAGWAGTVAEFLGVQTGNLVHQLTDHHHSAYGETASESQRAAWKESLAWLSAAFHTLPESPDWHLLLEYELPFENGRRPDAIVLCGGHAAVVEFKSSPIATRAAVDQVVAYARDLQEYHSAFRNTKVFPVVALPHASETNERWEHVSIVDPSYLPKAFRDIAASGPQLRWSEVADGTYAPLPSLVHAARRIFQDEPLPAIKTAQAAGIPEVVRKLHRLALQSARDGSHHLVLISGVPGAGKTLVGLQFVHESGKGDEPEAWFLSGNQPLVETLQDALRSTVFVRSMHAFVREYGVKRRRAPSTRIWVFDEAQRAFSRDYTREKQGINKSEPDILVELASERPDGSVLIGLIGEGQEIYRGEEAGIGQWADAISSYGPSFQIHAPQHLARHFTGSSLDVDEALNLTSSLRSHRALSSHEWVRRLMAGEIPEARAMSKGLTESGYAMYWTADLSRAKRYAVERYMGEQDKRYGLLASSMARNLDRIGVNVGGAFYLNTRKWFNAPPQDSLSCCQLMLPATEFQVQGLELDLPLVCWGHDLGWVDAAWRDLKFRKGVVDNRQLRINTYRVLLTRGRDGFVVFVPPELPFSQTDAIISTLASAGVEELHV